jgi:hypothetical protein
MHRLIYFVILLSTIQFGLCSDIDSFDGDYHFDTNNSSSLMTGEIIEPNVEDNVTESSLTTTTTTTTVLAKSFFTEVNLSVRRNKGRNLIYFVL